MSAILDTLPDRLPPQSLDAEQNVLGACTISGTAVELMLGELRADDFYLYAHKEIFDVIATLDRKNIPVDVLTVPEELRRRGLLDQIGGFAYINTLAESVPTAAHQLHYCRIVREKAQYRRLIDGGAEQMAAAYDQQLTPTEIAAQGEAVYIGLEQDDGDTSDILAADLFAARRQAMTDGVSPDLIKLRFPAIDRLTRLMLGNSVIIAGRPSMGKTLTALFLAFSYSAADHFTAYFAFEPTRDPLADRLIASMSGLPYGRIRGGHLTTDEKFIYDDATQFLEGLPLMFVDRSGMTVSAIRAKCLKLKRERNLEVIIIDQLSYVVPERSRNSRVDEFGERMRGLYRLGQDLKILVIVLHQLSRAVEARTPPRPRLSDLRESGDLEQDADVVVLLYRESYYKHLSRGEDEPEIGEMEWIQAKGRDIGTGIVRLRVDRSIQRIEAMGDTGYDEEDAPPAHLTPDPVLVQQAMFGDEPPDNYGSSEEWTSRI